MSKKSKRLKQRRDGLFTSRLVYASLCSVFCQSEQRSVSKCSLFIHVDPDQPLLLDKICRFCYHCNLIIAHQDQLEDQMATTFSAITPEIIGNTYEVLGTIDRSEWKGGIQDQLSVEELLEQLSRDEMAKAKL